jgi:mono/diheme cytochrome c family protein
MKTVLLTSLLTLAGPVAIAQDSSFSDPSHFAGKSGNEVYRGICQGCHMAEGQGAVGAGKYPALAKNQNLEAAGYPIYLIIHGQKAMPPLGSMLDDDQIAAVVEYIRTHFGNTYADPVTSDDVTSSR